METLAQVQTIEKEIKGIKICATLTSRSVWSMESGGIGYSDIVKVQIRENGEEAKEEIKEFKWRHQYNQDLDRPEMSVNKIEILEVEQKKIVTFGCGVITVQLKLKNKKGNRRESFCFIKDKRQL